MLEDEQRERLQPAANCTNGVSSTSRWQEEAISRSTLNPLAAEFVPASSAKSAKTQDLNHQQHTRDTRKLGRPYEMAKQQVNEPYQYSDFMYISTLSSLVETPLKMAVIPGDYIMRPYLEGFVFTKTDYYPEISQIVHVLDTRSGDPGLSGTYHDGDSKDPALLSIFNKYFRTYINTYEEEEHIREKNKRLEKKKLQLSQRASDPVVKNIFKKFFRPHLRNVKPKQKPNRCCSECDEEEEDWSDKENNNVYNEFGQKNLTEIDCYNNFPILFFLNSEPLAENLVLELKYENKEKNIILWDVFDIEKGKIGVAIKEKEFHNMMGDQMGLAIFSLNKTHGIAFANFNDSFVNERDVPDKEVFYPRHECDLIYNKYDWKKHYEEIRKKYFNKNGNQ